MPTPRPCDNAAHGCTRTYTGEGDLCPACHAARSLGEPHYGRWLARRCDCHALVECPICGVPFDPTRGYGSTKTASRRSINCSKACAAEASRRRMRGSVPASSGWRERRFLMRRTGD